MKNCTRILNVKEAERSRFILKEVCIELNIRKLREENNISINSRVSERNSGFSDWIFFKNDKVKKVEKTVDLSKCNYISHINSLI